MNLTNDVSNGSRSHRCVSELSTKLSISIDRYISEMATSLGGRTTGDRGQGVLEYAGVLLVVAAIVVAIVKLDLKTDIGNLITGAIEDVKTAKPSK